MNIYDKYPETVFYKGKRYRLRLSYDRVLRAFDAQEDTGIILPDLEEIQLALLLKYPWQLPKNKKDRTGLLIAIFDLFPKDRTETKTRVIDFHQDAAMIRSGFLRLGIDLTREKIHFFKFRELLSDLPADCALMRTIEIRLKPIPKPNKNNRDYIKALQEAKTRVAIKMTEDEQMNNFAESLKRSSVFMR